MKTIREQLTELGFHDHKGSMVRNDDDALNTSWHGTIFADTYVLSAQTYEGAGIVEVRWHISSLVPVAASLTALTQQLVAAHAAHAALCEVSA